MSLCQTFKAQGYNFFVGLPCSNLTGFIDALIGDSLVTYIAATREDVAISMAVGEVKFLATDVCLRADTGTMCGFAHINSNDQQPSLLNIRFTHFGVSSILFQSHEMYLPL